MHNPLTQTKCPYCKGQGDLKQLLCPLCDGSGYLPLMHIAIEGLFTGLLGAFFFLMIYMIVTGAKF